MVASALRAATRRFLSRSALSEARALSRNRGLGAGPPLRAAALSQAEIAGPQAK